MAAWLADTLFITGRLAEPALRNVLTELGIEHQITVMNISVAALMTTRWIAKRLSPPPGVDNIVIPGLCEGDLDTLQHATGLPVRKGPADVRALPEWYGREAVRAQLGPRDVRVFAEINDVQSLSREQVIDRAQAYQAAGADVIDLGLSLDRSWLTEGPPTIAALRERELSLSIDTLDPEHILMADAAGVDYVLSLTPETVDLAEEMRATPVLITEEETTTEAVAAADVPTTEQAAPDKAAEAAAGGDKAKGGDKPGDKAAKGAPDKPGDKAEKKEKK